MVSKSLWLVDIRSGGGTAVPEWRAAIAWAGSGERGDDSSNRIHAAHGVGSEIRDVKVALVVERRSLEVVECCVRDVTAVACVARGPGPIALYDTCAERNATDLVSLGVAKAEMLTGGIDRHLRDASQGGIQRWAAIAGASVNTRSSDRGDSAVRSDLANAGVAVVKKVNIA